MDPTLGYGGSDKMRREGGYAQRNTLFFTYTLPKVECLKAIEEKLKKD